MALTIQEKHRAREFAVKNANFMFIPTMELRKLIINSHPMTEDMNEDLRNFILEGKAIRLDPEMIIDYCDGKLSKKNTWLLDNGDIKVEPLKIDLT